MQECETEAWLSTQRLKGRKTRPDLPGIHLVLDVYCTSGWVCSQPLTAPHSWSPYPVKRQGA